jgi:hypothetical protein
MGSFKVDFNAMAWDEGRPGMRHKVYREGGRLVRLVEFSSSEGFDHWCEQGHIGHVLMGGLKIEFDDEVLDFRAGDGLFIPAGKASAHRSVSIIHGTRLLMVEDAAD